MKRNTTIDIIKGLGIILIVAGHSGSPVYNFVYLFHVAIFFIASGYCYNPKYSENLSSVFSFIAKKFKTLWLPYVLCNSLFVLLHNFFIKIHVYTNDPTILEYVSGAHICLTDALSVKQMLLYIVKNLFFIGGTQIGGATWFLACLMYLLVGYCVLDYIIRRLFKRIPSNYIQCALSIIFLIFGYLCSQNGWSFAGIERFLSFYCFIFIGSWLNTSGFYHRTINASTHFVLLLGSFLPLLWLMNLGSVNVAGNGYPNPIFLLAATLLGWQFLYEAATFAQKLPRLTKALIAIGQSTISIMIFHFLAFKTVSLMIVLLYKLPFCLIAAFPNLYGDKGWWILYTLVGVLLPFALHKIYIRVRHFICAL